MFLAILQAYLFGLMLLTCPAHLSDNVAIFAGLTGFIWPITLLRSVVIGYLLVHYDRYIHGTLVVSYLLLHSYGAPFWTILTVLDKPVLMTIMCVIWSASRQNIFPALPLMVISWYVSHR
jgi:hypothetical protein